MNEFLDRMSAILETPVTAETRFREVEGWSSLDIMGTILFKPYQDLGEGLFFDN